MKKLILIVLSLVLFGCQTFNIQYKFATKTNATIMQSKIVHFVTVYGMYDKYEKLIPVTVTYYRLTGYVVLKIDKFKDLLYIYDEHVLYKLLTYFEGDVITILYDYRENKVIEILE